MQFLDINVPQVVLTEVVESERGANYIRNLHEVHAVFRRIKASLEEESSSLDADERSRFQGTDHPHMTSTKVSDFRPLLPIVPSYFPPIYILGDKILRT